MATIEAQSLSAGDLWHKNLPGSFKSSEQAAQNFTCFPDLPKEIRLMIWEMALPGPRIVPLKRKALKKTIRQWEDENNALWPVLDGNIVPNPTPGDHTTNNIRRGLEDLDAYDAEDMERQRAVARNMAREIIYRAGYKGEDPADYGLASLQGWMSGTHPDILLVCREAYGVVCDNYVKAFTSFFTQPETYFDFRIDTLYLRCDEIFGVSQETIGFRTSNDGFRIDTRSRRKVERLAILLNPWDLAGVDFGEDPFVNLLPPIFALFSCLKDLVLVVNNLFSYDLPEEEASFAFIDRHLIHKAFDICIFESIFPSDPEHEIIDIAPAFEAWLPDLDMTALERKNRDDREAGNDWALPRIEFKLIVSNKVKMAIE